MSPIFLSRAARVRHHLSRAMPVIVTLVAAASCGAMVAWGW